MTEPWNLTEAQRRQFREAQIAARAGEPVHDPRLGEMLAVARRARGWSLREAERHSGVANAHLSQIETGTITRPSGSILLALADAYGIDPRPLLEAARDKDMAAVIEMRDRWQALRDWLEEQAQHPDHLADAYESALSKMAELEAGQ